MSKKMFGKFFILLLVVGLLFAVAPTGQVEAATPVSTPAELIAALSSTEPEITVTANIDADVVAGNVFTVSSGRTVTLDLNGHTISADTSNGGVFSNAGMLTILDNSIDKGGMIINTNTTQTEAGEVAKSAISNTGVLTVNSGVTVAGPADGHGSWGDVNFNPAYGIDNLGGGQVTVNGATISGANGLRNFANLPGTTITINSGIVTGKTGIAMQSFGTNDGTLTINGDTIVTATRSAIYAAGVTQYNHIVINGGTFSGEGEFGTVCVVDGTLDINGGRFTGNNDTYSLLNYYAIVDVTAGTFNGDIWGGESEPYTGYEGAGLTSFAPSEGECITVVGEIGGAVEGAGVVNACHVHNMTQDTYYTTIQAAIDDANSGDTVNVAAGTYVEGITIPAGKQLNFIGEVDADGNPLPVIKGTLSASSLTDKTWRIENLNFVDNGGDSISLNNGGNLTVSNCTFDGSGLFMNGHRAIQASGSQLTVENSTFQNGWYVSLQGNFTSLNVSNSTFTNVKSGINVQGPAGNTVTIDNTDFSVIAQGEGNDTYGVRFASSSTSGKDLTITNSSFVVDKNDLVAEEGTYHSAIIVRAGATGTLKVENSSILGEVVNQATPVLDASHNWWGSIAGPGASQISEKVDFTPWCTDDTCTTFGYPPVHNVTQDTYFSTIQAAVNAANANDEIHVAAGTYNEAITINKALTLQGAGDDVTIIDGTGLTATTLVSAPNLTSGALSIDGFTFKDDPTPDAALTYPVSIYNCQSPATASFTNNTIIGAGSADYDWGLLVQGGNCTHTIKNNLFDNVGGNAILIERALGDVEIGNNTFLVPNGNTSPAIWSMSYGTESDPHTVTGLHWYHDNTIQCKVDGGTIRGGIGFAPAYGEYAWNLRQYGSYTNVMVENNTIVDFTSSGIQVEVDGANSTFNGTIQNNILTAAPGLTGTKGIRLLGPVDSTTLLSNVITNAYRGIYLSGTWGQPIYPTNITIDKNQLAENIFGYEEQDTTNDQDASPNWWGSADGPADGYIVSNLNYLPYCTNPECTEFSQAKLSMSPATIEALTCGPQTLDVLVTDVVDLTSYHLEIDFDETKVRIDSVVNGGFLDNTENSIVVIEPGTDLGNTTGKLKFGAYLQANEGFGGDPAPVTGTGTLITITFTPLLGSTDFTVDATNSLLVSWPDAFAMPFSATGATATLTGGLVKNVDTSVNYCSLASAVEDATSGDHLQLLESFTIPATVTIDKALTLDLNGKTLTATGTALNIPGPGALTIDDFSTGDAGAIIADYRGAQVSAGGSLVLNKGTLAGNGFDGVFVYGEASSLTVDDGTITGLYYGISGNGSSTAPFDGATAITINGGTVQGGETAIFHPEEGLLKITGGNIIGGTYNGIEMKAGDLEITGGTITTSAAFVATPAKTGNGNTQSGDAILIYNRAGYQGTMTVKITGGTITSTHGYALREYTYTGETTRTTLIDVTGGSFTGGIGTGDAGAAVTFMTTDPAVLKLTDGQYNTDPGATPDYVFTPYDTYFDADWFMIDPVDITATTLAGPYTAGVPATVTVTVADTDHTGPFEVVFDYPEGTSIIYGETTVVCDSTGCDPIVVTLTYPGPTDLSFDVTLPGAGTYDVRVDLYHNAGAGDIRLLDSDTATGVVVNGDFTVTGTFSMQGRVERGDIPVTLTWGGTLVAYGPSANTTDVIDNNFTLLVSYGGTYTITTNQARYLNVITATGKTILVDGNEILPALRLRGGNAVWMNSLTEFNDKIDGGDASLVGYQYGTAGAEMDFGNHGDCNFDGKVNIQDLALVGGNFDLTSAVAYGNWMPQ